MPPRDARADVCLILEGTYPYVAGGVSSWVHELIQGEPSRTFDLYFIGPRRGAFAARRFQVPPNVLSVEEVYFEDPAHPYDPKERGAQLRQVRAALAEERGRLEHSRVLDAIRRLHFGGPPRPELLDELVANDLSIQELLHGRASFELALEVGEKLAPDAPFIELFWQLRSMHVPLVHVLSELPREAGVYHAVSAGFAGVVGAAAGLKHGRPFLLTEHGIYARERDLELARADWTPRRILSRRPREAGKRERVPRSPSGNPALRRLWSQFFHALSQLAYQHAQRIVTLSEVNRRKEVDDGAPEGKIAVIPNGVPAATGRPGEAPIAKEPGRPLRVGFVGRVVPIKDVITLVKGCDLALRQADLDVRLIGPTDEDPSYAARCRALVQTLGRTDQVRFVGPLPASRIYGDLDVVVLTSFSEGQPLVILEANAAGLPVVTTDVGACRELVEGRTPEDRALGPSGIVTHVARPEETAAALVLLAKEAGLRQRMGEAGRARVARFYQLDEMLRAYGALYAELTTWPG